MDIGEILKKPDRLGMRIRAERVRRGVRLVDLQRETGIPKSQICRFEKGQIKGSIRDFVAICIALQVNPMTMLCGSEQWKPDEVVL